MQGRELSCSKKLSTNFFPDNIKISLIVCSVTQKSGPLFSRPHGWQPAEIVHNLLPEYQGAKLPSSGSSTRINPVSVTINCILNKHNLKKVTIISTLLFHKISLT